MNYILRRETLMNAYPNGSIVFIYSNIAPMRSQDESYPFSVNRNFYYFTGIERENMTLMIQKDYQGKISTSLFIEPYDELQAKWVGGRMKPKEAKEVSQVDIICNQNDFSETIVRIFGNNRNENNFTIGLDLWKHTDKQAPTRAHEMANYCQNNFPAAQIIDINAQCTKLRLIKDSDEIEMMKVAQKTTKIAIEAMMKHACSGVNEMEMEAVFNYALMKQGVRKTAFPTIAAGGKNATTLHYVENNQIVQEGELLLCDLGSQHRNYCADITRTFPINGKFSERQKQIYNIVLQGQQLVIEAATPGKTLKDLNDILKAHYQKSLKEIGLLENNMVEDYYFHSVSHMLGLDTHDVDFRGQTTLQPGMVITVEPGLYIEAEGLGIRIEDDVLITEGACINLSQDILKSVDEIEAFMKK